MGRARIAPVLVPAAVLVASSILARSASRTRSTVAGARQRALDAVVLRRRRARVDGRAPRLAGARAPRSRWFAIGMTGYAAGQVLWDVQVASGWNPFPGPSDAFFLMLGACCTIGTRPRSGRASRGGPRAVAVLDAGGFAVAALDRCARALPAAARPEQLCCRWRCSSPTRSGCCTAACIGVDDGSGAAPARGRRLAAVRGRSGRRRRAVDAVERHDALRRARRRHALQRRVLDGRRSCSAWAWRAGSPSVLAHPRGTGLRGRCCACCRW